MPRVVKFPHRAPQPRKVLLCAPRASRVRHRKPILPQAARRRGHVRGVPLLRVGEKVPQVAAIAGQLIYPADDAGRFPRYSGSGAASVQRQLLRVGGGTARRRALLLGGLGGFWRRCWCNLRWLGAGRLRRRHFRGGRRPRCLSFLSLGGRGNRSFHLPGCFCVGAGVASAGVLFFERGGLLLLCAVMWRCRGRAPRTYCAPQRGGRGVAGTRWYRACVRRS
jgi:hypothetical protein